MVDKTIDKFGVAAVKVWNCEGFVNRRTDKV